MFVAYLMVTILLTDWVDSVAQTISLSFIEKYAVRICVDKFCASVYFISLEKLGIFSVCKVT